MKQPNDSDVNIITKKSAYQGFFKVNQYTLQHGLFAGGKTRILTRECFERGHAVGVLAYDPWLDNIVLLEQFRIGAYVYGKELADDAVQSEKHSAWLLEIIAGIVDPGEAQVEVAHREAQEEAGLELLALESIGDFYASPGGTSETTQLYCACVNSQGAGGIHGLEEEGEDIRVRVVTYEEAVQLLKDGRLNNASAMIAMQWLMLNRVAMRTKWHDLGKN
ncbi:NUDIX domain-containing protein [sulfur-oxidizing endosymbiont of Gigantopelta aegis]|uniref:NUDIX domain-containing protein n=1 Tax=sulfur-oxidizing endosymbiont of Gigantopelta aegis TaxID=2794934 RepID=UPI0018DC0BB6|nr:NUDIX domain-containing protein [sulfur-oxidizing endosymbiont of Gigantopelta aegis]